MYGSVETFKKRLKALEAKRWNNSNRITALEKVKEQKMVKLGYLNYVGNINGRIYQQTFIDTYSRLLSR
ncbi:MAG: hypothetical protein sL5_11110 [Candidatus Mesenet longicola]|uniref:Uncharacterized protein n=1 Tax=Candidatus Mesenet longicola TaxID=1892558 RepID=A0A8J3HR73_9RICK|nr:MAG: hypothetical protein sGL2_11500 [Candidatus Mesenet longicola]GHM60118.1 MAG: hypothetical protein sL5_11110 [Candidatus Mesenet longicola]